MRFSTDVNVKPTKLFQLRDFLGIDTFNSLYEVAPNRATYMRNFIRKDGVNHKRNGWKSLSRFDNIEGLFNFKLYDQVEEQDIYITIVCTDKDFYMSSSLTANENYAGMYYTKITDSCRYAPASVETLDIKEPEMFIFDNKAYFVGCGEFLVFGQYLQDNYWQYELRKVADNEDTYIPTTTININRDGDPNDVRATLEQVNLLSSYRKNTFVGTALGVETEETEEIPLMQFANEAGTQINWIKTRYIPESVTSITIDGEVETTGYVINTLPEITGYTIYFESPVSIENNSVATVVYSTKKQKPTFSLDVESIDSGEIDIKIERNIEGEVVENTYSAKKETLGNTETHYVNGTKLILYRPIDSDNEWFDPTTDITLKVDSVELTYGDDYTVDGKEITFTEEQTGTVEIASQYIAYLIPRDSENPLAGTIGEVFPEIGKFYLTIDTTPPVEGQANITVTFKKEVANNAKKIGKCKFGIISGVDGVSDRLFLSGNEEHPHIDYFSGHNDFTYFGEMDYNTVGNSYSPIIGYQQLSNGQLAIFKKRMQEKEANIYIRKGEYVIDETEKTITARFPAFGCYLKESPINRHTIANLGGEVLFASENGVYALALSEKVASQEMYSVRRSKNIDEILKNIDLSSAKAVVFNNKYYLAVGNTVYVADGSLFINGQYEWFVLTEVPAKLWDVRENELWFCTNYGEVCKFTDNYKDIRFYGIESGIMTADVSDNLIYSTIFEDEVLEIPQDGDKLENVTIYVKYKAITDIQSSYEGGGYDTLIVSQEDILNIKENDAITIPGITGAFFVTNINYTNCSFQLNKVTSSGFLIYEFNSSEKTSILSKETPLIETIYEAYIADVEEHLGDSDKIDGVQEKYYTFRIRKYPTGEIRELTTNTRDEGSQLTGRIYRDYPVVAEWYTPIFDLGRNDISKRLMGFTVFAEKIEGGDLLFGYDTRMVNELISVKGIDIFSFDNYDYTTFTYETGFVKSFTRKVKERAFNFIMFKFKSVNPADCIINSVTVRYKENRHTKGAE